MKNKRIYRCIHCGNIITVVEASGVNIVCCGEDMMELVANTTDAALEKHIPVIDLGGHVVNVKIGEIDHPMNSDHYIMWIYLETENGMQFKYFKPGDAPQLSFTLVDDKPLVVYAYCNLHGLWKKEIN